MYDLRELKYYQKPIKLMHEQLKAYIFQTTLDKRRQEYFINEQISDLKNEINNRLSRLESHQKIQMNTLANSIYKNGFNNFDSIAKKLFIYQRERENLADYMDDKLNKMITINNNMDNNSYRRYNNNFFNRNDYFK